MQLEVGTPLWRDPAEKIGVLPAATTTVHSIFIGVTLLHLEDSTGPVRVATSGDLPVRVKGPVKANDSLGFSLGHDYLEVGGAPGVATALAEYTGTNIKLIIGRFGGGGGGSSDPVWV